MTYASKSTRSTAVRGVTDIRGGPMNDDPGESGGGGGRRGGVTFSYF